ncbi:YhcN/YlaJ family sporulation lipoprotein [Litchfieldia alkalitelluris]|uniref:YhcN/YlaJ family sporulation lipoprotein n=1 Tax=Litchfieldia alkalitelluris TaxID=304268 RepID=UPI0009963772|nr:YhcN/YlaJ family sporulation lipoprotein [Litchfieldia alkalitelluris]
MKKSLIVTGICCLTALSGCGADEEQGAGIYKQSGNTINVNDTQAGIYHYSDDANSEDRFEDFGYVRHQKSPVPGDQTVYTMPRLDRELVADMISKMTVQQIPHVNEVATLVTDEEVLMVYDTDSDDRFETADQVKKTALSVIPRWYHVYVSDNPILIKDIERFSTLDSTSRNVDQIITSTIERMLESPQGRKISDGENANGEMSGGVNNEYERKMNDVPDFLQNPSTKSTTPSSDINNVETEGQNDEGEMETRGRTKTGNDK